MAEDNDDKTEDPSGRKLDEAKDRGQLGMSMDFNSSVVLLAGVAAIAIFGADFTQASLGLMREVFGNLRNVAEPTDQWFFFLSAHVLKEMFDMLWPILLVLLGAGLAVNLVQVGINFTTKPLEFDLSKVFSWSAITQIFSRQAWIELLKGIAKMVVISWVAYDCIAKRFDDILASTDMDLNAIIRLILDISWEMLWKVVLLLLILGFADWIYQKRKTFNDLKMTKQEAKDENKNTMGDPQVIQARKRAMYKMHQKFMMHEVPKATVVITNPTFIAIAIRYDRGKDQVPIVVGKGKRLIAEHIRNIAKEHNIPIVENKALARGMYDHIEVGQEVPQEFFTSVAEVLAYVFNMDQRKAAYT